MKIGLGVIASLCLVSSSTYIGFNLPIAHAIEPAKCPLTDDPDPNIQAVAITFLNSKCKEEKLDKTSTYYRYYSSDQNKYGRYLTTNIYKTNVEAIKHLALDQKWTNPNNPTFIETVVLPAGTTIYKGITGPQNPPACYPGGGTQIFIKDSRSSAIQWNKLGDLTVKELLCK
jgi:hypothetical protein